jgi:hypothetical protein
MLGSAQASPRCQKTRVVSAAAFPTTTMVRLTRAEMAFFKREGYLVVRGAMDKELCAAARDRLWETSESGVLQRDAPSTWLGPLPESDLSRDAMNARGEYRWQWRGGGAEDLLLDLLPRTCLEIAEQLLGEGTLLGLRPAGAEPTAEELEPEPVLAGKTPGAEIGTKCRGIYCTLPASLSTKPRSLNANACHTDGHPMSLGLVGLIDRVEPGGGSFAVWPRSHVRVFHKFKWQYSCRDETGANDFTPEYEAELAKIREDTVPVDCSGEA